MDVATDFYGSPNRRYYVIDRGDMLPPAGAERIYDREGVMIYRVSEENSKASDHDPSNPDRRSRSLPHRTDP